MSDSVFDGLEPRLVWERFRELKNTPRPSKGESEVMGLLTRWAEQNSFETRTDSIGNLCVHVPGSTGCHNAAPVILQNHVDIVVSNDENAPPDADAARGLIPVERGTVGDDDRFNRDEQGDWLRASWTTLGADNGIGCAYALAVSEMEDIRHPPLELLFTVDEEDGMSGALRMDPESLGLRGKTLLNLDTEDDDELTIGAAGGCDIQIRWEAERPMVSDEIALRIDLKDLKGGHSGIEINSGRANAIRSMAIALKQAGQTVPLRLVDIQGGDRRNAIPRFCQATVVLDASKRPALQQALDQCSAALSDQFAGVDYSIAFALADASAASTAFSVDDSQRLIQLLLAIPTGVFAMTPDIPDLPQTSNNLALISTDERAIQISCSPRSAHAPGMQDVVATLQAAAQLAHAEFHQGGGYPGWKPNLKSKLLEYTRKAYVELFDETPKVHAVHAGLECGVLASQIPGLDCISFGPTIRGNHAPGERVCISSVQKSFQLVTRLLADLAVSD